MPARLPDPAELDELRRRVAHTSGRTAAALAFEIDGLDDRLADGGLDDAALHDVAPASQSLSDDAAATLFTAGIAARRAALCGRRVLWAVTRFDLYAPGLEQVGLGPATLLFAEARDDQQVLALSAPT